MVQRTPRVPIPSAVVMFGSASIKVSCFFIDGRAGFVVVTNPVTGRLFAFSHLVASSAPSMAGPLQPCSPSSIVVVASSRLSHVSFSEVVDSLLHPTDAIVAQFPTTFETYAVNDVKTAPAPPPTRAAIPGFSV